MKEFTSCFIGIPLPDEYRGKFSDLLKRVSVANLDLEMVDETTPHITVYYLDKQSEGNLEEVRKIVEENAQLLKDENLIAGGMNTFGDDVPRVLFLPIHYPKSLSEFNEIIVSSLSKFMAEDNNLPFYPHMTVARFNSVSQASWEITKSAIESEMTKIKWQFPVTEVVIYGADSSKTPEHYEKLVSIQV